MNTIRNLNSGWEFSLASEANWLDAEVPGAVHTDLMRHNKIPDPFIGFNEDSVQWIEDKDWIYRTRFEMHGEEWREKRHELVFEGLDTYADVYLNGEQLFSADNMFIAWTMDCSNNLKEGENLLEVYFHSPVKKGMKKASKLDYFLIATNEQAPDEEKTNVFTRKAPFHFGWDWGPRLVTSGIWRPVYLKSWDASRITNFHCRQTSFSRQEARYTLSIETETELVGPYVLEVWDESRTLISRSKTALDKGYNEISTEMKFTDPQLWWTNGLGEAHLYPLSILLKKNNKVVDSLHYRLGIRKLELVQAEDSIGHSFHFELNGVPVFMKGANYIPGDIFIPRVSEEKYQRVIQETIDANMNMLRVWGGAIYENDIFYDLCDENGILVWQDFMFACAMQPGDPEHLENIRKEAEYNVKRLRNHPSLALWCGNNENLIAWHNWGWQDRYTAEQNEFHWKTYEEIFYKILPEAVSRFDPEKSYWPSSPQSIGDELPDRKSGDEHDWSIWFGQKDFSNYGNNPPRFASEYGIQSYPRLETIDYFAEGNISDELLNHRQRSNMTWIAEGYNGNDMIENYRSRYFPEPANFEEKIYLSQLSHQLATREAIEAHRRNMPYCMGSLYWQINDCWPTTSWSTVDYFGNWKAPHYEAAASFKKLIIAPEISDESIAIYVVSDELVDKEIELSINWMNNEGEFLTSYESEKISLTANHSTKVWEGKSMKENKASAFLLVRIFEDQELLDERWVSTQKPKDMELKEAVLTTTVSRRSDSYIIDIETNNPAFFVELDFPGVAGRFSDNFFDISPDSPKRIHFYTEEILENPSEILQLRSLNKIQ